MKTKNGIIIKALFTFLTLLLPVLIIPLGNTACNNSRLPSASPTPLEYTFMALEQTDLMVADSEDLVSVAFQVNEALSLQETPIDTNQVVELSDSFIEHAQLAIHYAEDIKDHTNASRDLKYHANQISYHSNRALGYAERTRELILSRQWEETPDPLRSFGLVILYARLTRQQAKIAIKHAQNAPKYG